MYRACNLESRSCSNGGSYVSYECDTVVGRLLKRNVVSMAVSTTSSGGDGTSPAIRVEKRRPIQSSDDVLR